MLEKLEITIELQSDTCCSTGQSNNPEADILISTDKYGLPIIKGTLIKGLLLENARLLAGNNIGIYADIFGVGGGKRAKIRIPSKASIENSDALHQWIRFRTETTDSPGSQNIPDKLNWLQYGQGESKNRVNKSNITKAFTSIRSNTAISEKDRGIAKKHSLRATQVVSHKQKKDTKDTPLRFSLTVFGRNLSKEEKTAFENLVKSLRHIGTGKHRGLGEVSCAVVEKKTDKRSSVGKHRGLGEVSCTKDYWENCSYAVDPLTLEEVDAAGYQTINLKITLLEDVVVSSSGGMGRSFLTGSEILGALARNMSDNGMSDLEIKEHLLKSGLKVSNAYPAIKCKQDSFAHSYPKRFSQMIIKRVDGKADNISVSLTNVYDEAEGASRLQQVQYIPLPSEYYQLEDSGTIKKSGTIKYIDADVAFSFHNTMNNLTKKRDLYTLSWLSEGQAFNTTISAPSKTLQKIISGLAAAGNLVEIGARTSAGFGLCLVENGEPGYKSGDQINTNKIIVDCLSDIILFDDNGENSLSETELLKELCEKVDTLKSAKVNITMKFVKETIASGYNNHWKLPKRQFRAIAKGSVLVLKTNQPILLQPTYWIGAQNEEGYGLVRLSVAEDKPTGYNYEEGKPSNEQSVCPALSDSIISLEENMKQNELREFYSREGVRRASKAAKSDKGAVSHSRFMVLASALQVPQIDKAKETELFKAYNDWIATNLQGKNNKSVREAAEKMTNGFAEIEQRISKESQDYIESLRAPDKNERLDELFSSYVKSYIRQMKISFKLEGGE